MVTVVGNNIAISIDSTDYTAKIIEFSESGGEKQVKHKKMFGNNYKTVVVGRSDYQLTLKFKYDTALESTLFGDDDTDSVTITITDGVETITYNNMINSSYLYEVKNDDVAYINIIYTAPAKTDGDYNRSVVAI